MHTTRRAMLFATASLTAACAMAQTTTPPQPDWDEAALAEVLAYAKSQKTTGFLIIQNGHTISEHNWPLPDDATQFRNNFTHGSTADGVLLEDVASQQKSFIAILVGIAIDKGLLDVEQSVSAIIGGGWSKAPGIEPRITIRHLLEMNSGLTDRLTADAEPGAKFHYNTPAYAILKLVLEQASGKSLDAITAEWLTQPAGMSDTAWRQRPAAFARVGNPTGLVTTPRDIARMGQLILDGGRSSSGSQVISKEQIDAMLAPTTTNPAYAHLWWLNSGDYHHRPASDRRFEGPLIPTAPRDLIAAQGAMDRKLFIVPSTNLVVVRTGQGAAPNFNAALWRRIMRAAPD